MDINTIDLSIFETSDAHSTSANRFEGLTQELQIIEHKQFQAKARDFLTDITRTNAKIARRNRARTHKFTDLRAV